MSEYRLERTVRLPKGIDPSSLFWERKRGLLFVSDRASARILYFDTSGRQRGQFGGVGTERVTFLDPRLVGITSSGLLLIRDGGSREIASNRYQTVPARLVRCHLDGRYVDSLPINGPGTPGPLKLGRTLDAGYSLFAVSGTGPLFAVHTDTTPVSPWGEQKRQILCQWEERHRQWKPLFPIQSPDKDASWQQISVSPEGKVIAFATNQGRVFPVDRMGRPLTYPGLRGSALTVVRSTRSGFLAGTCVDDRGGVFILETEIETSELGPRSEVHGKNGVTVYPLLSDKKGTWIDLTEKPRGIALTAKESFAVLLPHTVAYFSPMSGDANK